MVLGCEGSQQSRQVAWIGAGLINRGITVALFCATLCDTLCVTVRSGGVPDSDIPLDITLGTSVWHTYAGW